MEWFLLFFYNPDWLYCIYFGQNQKQLNKRYYNIQDDFGRLGFHSLHHFYKNLYNLLEY